MGWGGWPHTQPPTWRARVFCRDFPSLSHRFWLFKGARHTSLLPLSLSCLKHHQGLRYQGHATYKLKQLREYGKFPFIHSPLVHVSSKFHPINELAPAVQANINTKAKHPLTVWIIVQFLTQMKIKNKNVSIL